MRKIFVGLSGGVDSGVSAALLKEQGYDVVGAFIKIWQPEFTECTWREDRLDAMRIAAALQIPFREIDLSEEYKTEVVADMIASYSRGITPNPDVLCNRHIKFGHFSKWAFSEGADYVATGHYASLRWQGDALTLTRGKDRDKDQSYFLYRLTQEDLARTLFPVGDYQKSQVRAMAERFGLPVAKKADSQGLCFVGDVSIPEFLSRYISVEPGKVLDMSGKEIGSHDGAAFYTIGQRHGFRVESSEPHYVVAVDIATNTIRVSTKREDAARKSPRIIDPNWLEKVDGEVEVQTRYRETPVIAAIRNEVVEFREPHIFSAGQSLVAYRGDVCLGGGIIAPTD